MKNTLAHANSKRDTNAALGPVVERLLCRPTVANLCQAVFFIFLFLVVFVFSTARLFKTRWRAAQVF